MTPHFIGLGAQKSGTSWIYANLADHPQVYIPRKEIHFFSREHHFVRGIQWYRNLFSRCGQDQQCGEFSTSYLYSEKAAERIYLNCPGVKLIVVLRNPVDRAFSNYKNDIMAGRVIWGTGFLAALKEHPEYLEQGFYAEQLQRYFRYFPREQILILIYEDIKKNPAGFMSMVYNFLGIDGEFISPHLHKRINPSYVPKNQSFEMLLNRLSSMIKGVGRGGLAHVLKKTGIHKVIREGNREAPTVSPELAPGEREKLLSIFSESVERLEEIIKRELPGWKT